MTLLTREFEQDTATPSALEVDRPRETDQLLIEEARRRQRRRQRWIASLAAVLVVAASVFYALSSGAAKVHPSTVPAAPVSLASFSTCAVVNLHAAFSGEPEGAAGTIYYTLKVTNKGAACTLPPLAVRAINTASSAYVGPWSRVEVTNKTKTVLAKGHAAYVPVGVGQSANWPTSLCRAANATGLRVVEAGNHATIGTLVLRASVCTITQSLHTQSASLNPNGG